MGPVSENHTQPVFRATIEVPSHAIKKNSRPIFRNSRTGKSFIGKSERLRSSENFLVQELRRRADAIGLHKPIEARLRCMLWIGFAPHVYYTKKLTENRKLGDCTNLAQIVEDALQSAGVIKNDWQLAPITIDRVCTDKNQYTVELYADQK